VAVRASATSRLPASQPHPLPTTAPIPLRYCRDVTALAQRRANFATARRIVEGFGKESELAGILQALKSARALSAERRHPMKIAPIQPPGPDASAQQVKDFHAEQQAARAFEAIFVKKMLSSLENTSRAGSPGQAGGGIYGSMMVSSLADAVTQQGGIGLSDMIMRALQGPSSSHAAAPASPSSTSAPASPPSSPSAPGGLESKK
jgi:Rod binding domain-containing protein